MSEARALMSYAINRMCLGDAIKTHKKKFRNDVYAAMRGDEDTIIEPFIVRIY